MESVHLNLVSHSYDIFIGSNLLSDRNLITEKLSGRQVIIITNETVSGFYLDQLKQSLSGFDVHSIAIPDGESYKTLETFEKVISEILVRNYNRQCTVFALGGGVVGDLAGFVAACYQRGVPCIQVPTTLLSQVDSSVGGKTAVNHPLGKNMIGAFHQPVRVIIDTDTLCSLPKRELIAGLAEVIKYGLMADRSLFEWLEKSSEDLRALKMSSLVSAIKRSCEIKAAIVMEDEKETGRRALLNFGHTFGHAIETSTGYGEWLHGEAVGAGMVMASDLSVDLGYLSAEDAERITELISRAGLPVSVDQLSGRQLFEAMQHDKKANDSGLRFVVLKGIGQAELVSNVASEKVLKTLNRFCPGPS